MTCDGFFPCQRKQNTNIFFSLPAFVYTPFLFHKNDDIQKMIKKLYRRGLRRTRCRAFGGDGVDTTVGLSSGLIVG
jgi:hypothetical protein